MMKRMFSLVRTVILSALGFVASDLPHKYLPSNTNDPKLAARYALVTDLRDVISGSATMIGPNIGLSAAHVCDPKYPEIGMPGDWMITLYDVNGNASFAVPVAMDIDNDICVFITDPPSKHWIGVAIDVKEDKAVTSYAYPLGVYSEGVALKFTGFYAGINEQENLAVFTIPATHGSSGAAIYTNHGVVGIVSKVTVGFDSIVLGPKLSDIHRILALHEEYPDEFIMIHGGQAMMMSINVE